MNSNPISFSEKQRFNQVWIWLILMGINGQFIFAIIYQVIYGNVYGNNPMNNNALIVSTFVSIIFNHYFFLFA